MRADGRITNPKLEINVAEHCNLSCRGCSHLSPVLAKRLVDPATVGRDLRVLARHYRADQVRLVGGEPLLHPDLAAVLGAVRASGVTGHLCLVTNGILLPRLAAGVWGQLDSVEVSQYPGKSLNPDQRRLVRRAAREAGVALKVVRVRSFRAPYSEVGTDDPDLIRRIYGSCKIVHTWRCHTVTDGWFFRCPPSYFLPQVLAGRYPDPMVDGLVIEDSDGFGPALADYLASTEPPQSCANCLGTAGRLSGHTLVRRADFRAEQAQPSAALVSRVQLRPTLARRGRRVESRLGALLEQRSP